VDVSDVDGEAEGNGVVGVSLGASEGEEVGPGGGEGGKVAFEIVAVVGVIVVVVASSAAAVVAGGVEEEEEANVVGA